MLGQAHPHMLGGVALIHNGIIEKFLPLREDIQKLVGGSRARPTARWSPISSTISFSKGRATPAKLTRNATISAKKLLTAL